MAEYVLRIRYRRQWLQRVGWRAYTSADSPSYLQIMTVRGRVICAGRQDQMDSAACPYRGLNPTNTVPQRTTYLFALLEVAITITFQKAPPSDSAKVSLLAERCSLNGDARKTVTCKPGIV